jgi:hypothetical protein
LEKCPATGNSLAATPFKVSSTVFTCDREGWGLPEGIEFVLSLVFGSLAKRGLRSWPEGISRITSQTNKGKRSKADLSAQLISCERVTNTLKGVAASELLDHHDRALFQPPPSKPGLRLSPHPAFQCSTERASVVVAVVDLLVARQADYERLPLPRDHHGLPRLLGSPPVSSQIRELADVVDLDSVPTSA